MRKRRRRSPPQNQKQKHVEEEGTKILNWVDSFQDPVTHACLMYALDSFSSNIK
jgi:hypothetical protein